MRLALRCFASLNCLCKTDIQDLASGWPEGEVKASQRLLHAVPGLGEEALASSEVPLTVAVAIHVRQLGRVGSR